MTYGIHALYEPVMEQRNSRTSHSDMFENTARKDGSGQSSPAPPRKPCPPGTRGALAPGFGKPTGHAAAPLGLGTAAPDPLLL